MQPHKISIHAPCTGSDKSGVSGNRQDTISIHAPCTGSDHVVESVVNAPAISIHAPCTGSDMSALGYQRYEYGISIHAPCTGSDLPSKSLMDTPSYFNPRSLHGERRRRARSGRNRAYFNPRSLHGERHRFPNQEGLRARFQSTLPARGATKCESRGLADRVISIHAPCTGSD